MNSLSRLVLCSDNGAPGSGAFGLGLTPPVFLGPQLADRDPGASGLHIPRANPCNHLLVPTDGCPIGSVPPENPDPDSSKSVVIKGMF